MRTPPHCNNFLRQAGMKSVQVVARGRAEFIDTPRPQVRPGFAVVRTSHLSLCGSDIRMLHHAADDCYPFPPGTSGHEMVGVIEEIVDGNQSLARGDRVLALAPGHQAMCEYYLAPLDLILPLPPGKPIEVLLQAQQLGTVLYAAKRLPNLLGRSGGHRPGLGRTMVQLAAATPGGRGSRCPGPGRQSFSAVCRVWCHPHDSPRGRPDGRRGQGVSAGQSGGCGNRGGWRSKRSIWLSN